MKFVSALSCSLAVMSGHVNCWGFGPLPSCRTISREAGPMTTTRLESCGNLDRLGSSSALSMSSHRRMTTVSIARVSVSPQGFFALLQIPQQGFWPLQMTQNPLDQTRATSPEALTLLQLISGVDMAGANLPPNVLAKLVVLYAEARPDQCRDILDMLQHPMESYSQANEWQRSRIRLPQVSLDELTLYPLRLDVTVKGFGKLSFCPSKASLQQVCWDYNKASKQFMSLALALRYKAPMVIHHAVVDKVLLKNYSDGC